MDSHEKNKASTQEKDLSILKLFHHQSGKHQRHCPRLDPNAFVHGSSFIVGDYVNARNKALQMANQNQIKNLS